jgi:hypothetical protein
MVLFYHPLTRLLQYGYHLDDGLGLGLDLGRPDS